MYTYIYIYIYIERERERLNTYFQNDRDRNAFCVGVSFRKTLFRY